MRDRLRNSYIEIDLGILAQNYKFLEKEASIKMAPMVKADAYGHGDIPVARKLEQLGASYLGVALVEEGLRLREAGIQIPILVFASFDQKSAAETVKNRLTPVIGSFQQLEVFKSLKSTAPQDFPIHLEFNTGMQRLGFEPEEAENVAEEFLNPLGYRLEGVCTHFCSSDDFKGSTEKSQTLKQIEIFQKIRGEFKKRVQPPLLYHYSNSGAVLGHVVPTLDIARPGIALYTHKPVLKLKSAVVQTRTIQKNTAVSYGGKWVAAEKSTLAVIPMGYADGIPRILSNKGSVLIRGISCPIAGVICMDYFMVDATPVLKAGHPLEVGDEVVLIGDQKGASIKVEDIALTAQTISYEILTGLQSRLPRVYIHST